ncbi:MAG: hypothetical protein HYV27_16805 [Candidatus Hydrogenedentes bacterium]|nr:hypothetical protein [Candidatus Hydrogenedentota bacterium]
MFTPTPPLFRLLTAALLTLCSPALLLLAGCGGEETPEPAVAVSETAAPATETPADAAPAPAELPVAEKAAEAAQNENLPATVAVMQYLPDGAQVAVGLPAINAMLESARPLAERIVEADVDIDEVLAEAATDAADDLGLSNVSNFPQLADAIGVDPNGATAAFLDFRHSVEKGKERKAEADALKAAKAAEAGATAAPAEGTAEDGNAADTTEDAADAPEDAMEPEQDQDEEPFELFGDPEFLLVVTIADEAKAREALKRIIEKDASLRDVAAEQVEVGGLQLTIHEPFGYAFHKNHLLVGASRLLRDAAAKVAAPVQFRYGSAECPPYTETEIVALVYGNRILPLIKDGADLIQTDESLAPLITSYMDTQATMLGTEDDPLVITLSQSAELLKLAARVDNKTHPGLATIQGLATPLRLAQLLPERTLAYLSLRFNQEFKDKYLLTQLNAASSAGLVDPASAPIAIQVIQMLGDEVTLGITGIEEDFPALMLMISFAQPELTMSLITMMAPMVDDRQHNGVDIKILAVESPVPLWIASMEDVVMVSNSPDTMKSIIDLHKAKETTLFLKMLAPPQDPALPVRQSIYLNTDILTEVVGPVAEMQGGLREGDQETIDKVYSVVRELRLLNSVEGTWENASLTLHLKPEGQAPAAEAPAAEPPAATPGPDAK